MCNPRVFYDCLKPRLVEYVRKNEATKCNCPRQCRRLSYDYTVSQAQFSDFLVLFAKDFYKMNQTEDEVRHDYCGLEV